MTRSIIENFFYAIHRKQLVVEISPADGRHVAVNHETIDQLFSENPLDPSYHYNYYKAVRERTPSQTPEIDRIGALDVHALIGSGPRRISYVNRSGMLITDSREQKVNPLAPRGNSLWPDYAVVVAPATDKGDEWIRTMENPSHDSVSPGQLEERERRRAERVFKEVRDAVRAIIDEAAQIEKYGDTTNLNELAALFPDELNPRAPGNRMLKTRVIPTPVAVRAPDPIGPETAPGSEPRPEPTPNPDSDPKPDTAPDPRPGPQPTPRPNPTERPARPPSLDRPRFIPTSPSTATVAFTFTEAAAREIGVALALAGESGQEGRIEIIDAAVLSPDNREVSVDNGALSLTPNPGERIVIQITANDRIDDKAFRIG